MAVFVLDKKGRPLMPCSEKRARKLLAAGRARIHKRFPFSIRLIDRLRESCILQPLRLALDPGSRQTGLAVTRVEGVIDDGGVIEHVMHIRFLMELVHRGQTIREALQARGAMRGRRRGCLRYRAPRFNNRIRPPGWLAPSLRHRVETSTSWVKRLRRLAPITHLAQELVRFDMQAMQDPDIEGAQYQQGTLAGYEVREYLLEKWGRCCAYCDAQNTPLQIEHIQAKAKGGSNRVSNLCLSCQPCNQKKAAQDIQDFLANDKPRLAKILTQAKKPLNDASAVNSTRWALFESLRQTGLPVELGSGGQTKFNRSRLGISKTHSLDAACVGNVKDVKNPNVPNLRVKCTGRGSRWKTNLDRYGFPRGYLTKQKTAFGFRTGDMVVADVPAGKKAGVHKGRVAIRMTGYFNIQSGVAGAPPIQGISHKHCRIIQRADGYGYALNRADHTGREQVKPKASDALPSTLYRPSINAGVSCVI